MSRGVGDFKRCDLAIYRFGGCGEGLGVQYIVGENSGDGLGDGSGVGDDSGVGAGDSVGRCSVIDSTFGG